MQPKRTDDVEFAKAVDSEVKASKGGSLVAIAQAADRPATNELKSELASNFSLTRGGPLYRLQARFSGAEKERTRVTHRAFVITVITWMPLLVLSLMQGLAYNSHLRIPFLLDFAVNVRFLIAFPLLILAESRIDHELQKTVGHFLKSGLVKEAELPSFEAVIKKVERLRDHDVPEIIMLALAFIPSFTTRGLELLAGHVSTWHSLPGEANSTLSYAGWWFGLVSVPLFRFLLIRWTWRILLWTYFLRQVSRIDLHFVPTHADLAAGFGFLGEAQRSFAPIVFAGGSVISAQVANAIIYEGDTLSGMKSVMIGYCVFAMLLLTAPLLVVMPKLIKVRKKGLLEYGALEATYGQEFAAKWIKGKHQPGETPLGSDDIQSLADMGNSFVFVRDMRVIPVDKRTFLVLAVAAALPLIPMLIFVTPTDQLIRTLLKFLA